MTVGELFAFHHGFSVSSGGFSSVASSFGTSFNSFCAFFSSAFSGFCAFFSSSGRVFGNRLSVGSHGVAGFAHGISGFTASSEAQSRGGDCSSKNDLTHNLKSLFSELLACGPFIRAHTKVGF